MRTTPGFAASFVIALVGGALLLPRAGWSEAPSPPGPTTVKGYVGSAVCAGCHAPEAEAWRDSHHDLAMQPATTETVLGDFDDATFEHFGSVTTFYREDGRYLVRTQGADGEVDSFPVDYVFGVEPLQQLLIAGPGGRLQAFGIAWDTRQRDAGGQRWFTLHPDQQLEPGEPLHWTSRDQTWNWMCADCHSTALARGYDAGTDAYATTWAEIDVGCEACHGPGATHVARAEPGGYAASAPHGDFSVDLSRGGIWEMADEARGIATLSGANPEDGAAQIDTCAACHARRRPLVDGHHAGTAFLDDYAPALLDQGLYYPDGQIRDEVYVWGSFLQSPMYRAGVVCSDCHDPHSTQVRAEGNALCSQCHLPERFGIAEHHRHAPGSEAAQCVTCHMPTETYMVVDPRRDHSFRTPRPDLAATLGTPDVCTGCHADRDAAWAAGVLERWHGPRADDTFPSYAEALAAARDGAAGAGSMLAEVVLDGEAPAIARATALSELGPYLAPDTAPAVEAGLAAPDPLMRRATIETLQGLDPSARLQLIAPLLNDPLRSVRIAAASALSDLHPEQVGAALRPALEKAFAEYVTAERVNGDRPESWVNLAGFHFRQGDALRAEQAFARARRRDPAFVPAYVNHADMLRAQGREPEAERMLRQGLAVVPDGAELHHALGLLLVRTGRREAALAELAEARRLAPGNARFGYVYGVALESLGRPQAAFEVWEGVLEAHPNDRAVLESLTVGLARAGAHKRALPYAERLLVLLPDDPGLQRFVAQLRASTGR